MIRLIRILGVMLMVAGGIVILTWFIEPLREAMPLIRDWFVSLPIAIRVGLIIAAIGFTLLFSSVVWERLEDRKSEHDLLDE